MLTGARRYTDRFETLRRARPLGLAPSTEIQWELLPVLAYELPEFTVAGALEPTYDIGGDSFNYTISAQQITITISDAVGHGLRAALLGSLAVTATRNTRRAGGDITTQLASANHHLAKQFPGSSFVTVLALQIDVATGNGIAINAGHPPPLLLPKRHSRTTTIAPGLFSRSIRRANLQNPATEPPSR